MEIALGIILVVISVALIILVLMQSGKSKSLSGAIAGGSDSFFSKAGGNKNDKIKSVITGVLAVLFCVVVLIMYVSQDSTSKYEGNYDDTTATVTATAEAEA